MGTAANYNNTSIPYGARTETFYRGATLASGPGSFSGGTSKGTYVCETVALNRPLVVIKRRDELGAPNGSVGVVDYVSGSFTVQLATTSSAPLQPGDTFNDTFDTSIGAEAFIITDIDQPEGQTEYKKQSVKFLKLY